MALVVVSLLVVVGAAYYLTSRDTSECSGPDSISIHVYNPYRLDVIKSCTTASGFVDNVLKEADGDYHIRLALDSQYSSLTNAANDQYQSDAVSACQSYSNSITIPSINDHITVTGPYVLDTDHHDWAEIHPVYALTIS